MKRDKDAQTLEQIKREQLGHLQALTQCLIRGADTFGSLPPESAMYLRIADRAIGDAIRNYNRVMQAAEEVRRELQGRRLARELDAIADAVLTLEPDNRDVSDVFSRPKLGKG